MSSVPALSDEELRTAISTLNHSTEAVAKQTEALKLQQDALSRLVKSSEKNRDGREDMELKQAQKWDTERKAAAAAVCVHPQRRHSFLISFSARRTVAESRLQDFRAGATRKGYWRGH